MNYRRFALAFTLSATTALAAYAAPMVMVQFGSFETMDEAQKRLAEVKSNAAISGLSASVKEVKLPPDNLIVYRTQAGPVDSRATAQSICSKFAANGSECYVVETAFADKITPATDIANAVTAPVTAAVAATTKVVEEKLPATTALAAMPQASTPSTTETPKKSFWSRVSPFDDETKPTAPKTETALVVKSAPENLNLAPTAEEIAKELPTAPEAPKVMLPEVTLSTPVVEMPKVSTPAISLAPQTYAQAPALPILPPPPLLTPKDEAFLKRNMPALNLSKEVKKPEVIAEPIITTPAVAAPTPVAEAPLLPAANGNVKVEEAKRVPLTEEKKEPIKIVQAPPATPPLATSPQAQPAVSLLPSSTLGQRTLWARIGQFKNPQEAFAFWEKYRQTHPDFPVVRVRVVSSVLQQKHGNDRVSLNVGPFAREGFIRNLCTSISSSDVSCGHVTDMGIASRAQPPASGYLNGSRYKR